MREWEARAYLNCQGCLADATIAQHCYSPTVHIWQGRKGLGGLLGEREMGEADLNHDGWGGKPRESEWGR